MRSSIKLIPILQSTPRDSTTTSLKSTSLELHKRGMSLSLNLDVCLYSYPPSHVYRGCKRGVFSRVAATRAPQTALRKEGGSFPQKGEGRWHSGLVGRPEWSADGLLGATTSSFLRWPVTCLLTPVPRAWSLVMLV